MGQRAFYAVRKFLCICVFAWPFIASPQSLKTPAFNQRDLHALERLKQELAKAESLPGGLERVRQIQRQIKAIERGTDIRPMELYEDEKFRPQDHLITESKSTPPSFEETPGPSLVSLTETSASRELDLFHDKTISVGEDYGVPRDVMATETQRRKTAADSDFSSTLEIPSTPVKKSKQSSLGEDPSVFADAMTFKNPSSMKDSKSFHVSPREQGTIVPSLHPGVESVSKSLPWKASREDILYLEERLKATISKLIDARKMLQKAGSENAHVWTSRIYKLETKKQSILRQMKALGVTPSFKTVSSQENHGFGALQSQENQLKHRLHEIEKKIKKVQRQIKFTEDPELLNEAGESITRLEQDRKLIESSLKTLKANSAAVDLMTFVESPSIYHTPVEVPSIPEDSTPSIENLLPPSLPTLEKKKLISQPEETEEEQSFEKAPSSLWSSGLPLPSEQKPPVQSKRQYRLDNEDANQILTQWDDHSSRM